LVPKPQNEHAQSLSVGFKQALYTFIKIGEGSFQEEAFCDSYYTKDQKERYTIAYQGKVRHPAHLCTYWSIGYGTSSFQGEVVTIEEALQRKKDDVDRRHSKITSDCLTENQRIATVDFLYQHGINSSGVLYKANTCNISGVYNMLVWWRDRYNGKIAVN
jgi:GH24 family phage-related lysozyme (muramidase)